MTDKQTEAMTLALEALKKCDSALAEELAAWDIDPPLHHVLEASNACGPAITALREALAEQPAQRTWVELTHDEIKAAYLAVSEIEWAICGMDDAVPFTRIIEAKLREKNT